MNDNQFLRTEALIGKEASDILKKSNVAVFGIGGVGGFTCEALARAGIGNITIVDNDDVDLTNLNRQIIALHSTLGRAKIDIMRERILDINPNARVNSIKKFYLPGNSSEFDLSEYDYIVDAIDTVTAKIELIMRARESGVPMIASMGTGNKLDPTMFEVTDISKTSVCPLAKVMRRELKKRDIRHLKVLYSKEEPNKMMDVDFPASISFVPPVAGLIIAGEVIKDLIKEVRDGKSQG